MKQLITSIMTIFILCNNIYAQGIVPPTPFRNHNMTVIDSGYLRILYAFNATDISNQETYDDLQRLEIGSHISKYYSYFAFNNDSLINVYIKTHPNAQGIPGKIGELGKKQTWDEYIYSEYFKDYDKNILTHYLRKPHGGGMNSYQYSEVLPEQTWKITEDTLSIAGYICQQATCRFRGRNFTAWFAMDIPVQNGPWKFGGLPGLILKIYDDDKLHVFECVKVENFKKKYPIKIYDYGSYEKTDRQKLLKFIKRLYDDYPNVAGLRNMDGSPKIWQKIPYNPLELE